MMGSHQLQLVYRMCQRLPLAFVRYDLDFADAIQELRGSAVSFQDSHAPIRRALDLGADLPSRSALRAEHPPTTSRHSLPPPIVSKQGEIR